MPEKKFNWEAFFLLFALIFTVLLGLAFETAFIFKLPVPWLVLLILSAALAYGLRYFSERRRQRR